MERCGDRHIGFLTLATSILALIVVPTVIAAIFAPSILSYEEKLLQTFIKDKTSVALTLLAIHVALLAIILTLIYYCIRSIQRDTQSIYSVEH
jgi:phosphotransferase system  glucose/maltose/N-acetylglucosamine-specific IIC component